MKEGGLKLEKEDIVHHFRAPVTSADKGPVTYWTALTGNATRETLTSGTISGPFGATALMGKCFTF